MNNNIEEFRQEKIIQILNDKFTVSVPYLVEILELSPSTIRRDLAKLEQQGRLERIYNGAKSIKHKFDQTISGINSAVDTNTRNNKYLIGKAAAELCNDGDNFLLCCGTTVGCLGEELCGRNLQITTNYIPLAQYLAENQHANTTIIGGQYDQVGKFTIPMHDIDPLYCNAQYMFTSGSSLSELGLYKMADLSIFAEKHLLANAEKIVVLVDSSKVGKNKGVHFLHPKNIDIVITNKDADSVTVESLRKQGIKVILT